MRNQRYHGVLRGFFPFVAVAMLVWWRWRPFRVEVEGESMRPALEPGDWLLAIRAREIRRGMLVVVEHPERPDFEMVKRIGATPGEFVTGRIMGPDEFWVVGDYAKGSSDSRTFGPVSAGAIKGHVVLRYWPAGRPIRLRSSLF